MAVKGLQDSAGPRRNADRKLSRESEGRVLVAEQRPEASAYLLQLLGNRWDVELVADGLDAVQAVQRARPDLVLAAVTMPRMNGFELVQALRSDPSLGDLSVLLLSTASDEDSALRGLQLGADDHLAEPFTARELLARVSGAVTLARTRAELAHQRSVAQLATERALFLNMAAHELRAPLTVIAGYVAMILDGDLPPGSHQGRQALKRVAQKTKEGADAVEQLLLAARMEAGAVARRSSSVDLRVLAAEAVERAASLVELESGELISELPKRPVMASVDQGLVSRVIDNLITNAIVHGASPIRVVVTDTPPTLTVMDQGPGIPADLKERIFEPFFQLERQLGGHRGTGLGLAVSRHLAELHGGFLELDEVQNGGASFSLRLPAPGV